MSWFGIEMAIVWVLHDISVIYLALTMNRLKAIRPSVRRLVSALTFVNEASLKQQTEEAFS